VHTLPGDSFDLRKFLRHKGNESGRVVFAPVRLRRKVRGVRFEEQLFERERGGDLADVVRTGEGDHSADPEISAERKKLPCKIEAAGITVEDKTAAPAGKRFEEREGILICLQ